VENIQTAKSLLKKLSALRATIPDDEQLYLDKLIMGADEEKPHTPTPPLKPAHTAPNGMSVDQPDDPVSFDPITYIGKIVWNNNMEIYELG